MTPTAEQQAVIHAPLDCHIKVEATAGSGKSTTMVERVDYLIRVKGISPSVIRVVMYNTKAAEQFRAKLEKKGLTAVTTTTFHALALHIVNWATERNLLPRLTLLSDEREVKQLLRQAIRTVEAATKPPKLTGKGSRKNQLPDLPKLDEDMATHSITTWKAMLTMPEHAKHTTEHRYVMVYEEFEKLRAQRKARTFDDLITDAITLLLSSPVAQASHVDQIEHLIIDEFQDVNFARLIMMNLLAGNRAKVTVVGDASQCQPPGSWVDIQGGGKVAIENLDPLQHKLISFSPSQSAVLGHQEGFGFSKRERAYAGPMYTLSVGDTNTKCTPEHLWLTSFNEARGRDLHVTYLMRKGSKFRVGQCALWRKAPSKSGVAFGPIIRAQNEGAEGLWILGVYSSALEAQTQEQIISCRFGLPTTCFHSEGRRTNQDTIDLIFQGLGDLGEQARLCLATFKRAVDFPFWTPQKQKVYATFGLFGRIFETCNLLPECMSVPVPRKGRAFEWVPFTLTQAHYEGQVYSLEVEQNPYYVVDGIITHNCHPPGTQVLTTQGEVPIEELKPGHKLVSYNRLEKTVCGRRYGYDFELGSRPYEGPLTTVHVGAHALAATPEHKWTVRIPKDVDSKDWYALYMMRKGSSWRLGECSVFYSNQGKPYGFGPSARARAEEADDLWVLKLYPTKSQVMAAEQILSCQYGIPTVIFQDPKQAAIFEALPNTEEAGLRCLEAFGRSPDFPLWSKKSGEINSQTGRKEGNQHTGRRAPITVMTCNLLPEIMVLPVPSQGLKYTWESFTLSTAPYKGPVFSLDVKPHHHYIANGIVTQNCLFEFLGARASFIESGFADMFNHHPHRTYPLSGSFRFGPQLARFAWNVIRNNEGAQSVVAARPQQHTEVTIVTEKDGGIRFVLNLLPHLIGLGAKMDEIVVLVRNRNQSHELQSVLLQAKVPFYLEGSIPLLDTLPVQTMLAYLRLVRDLNVKLTTERVQDLVTVCNRPSRYLKHSILEALGSRCVRAGLTLADLLKNVDAFIAAGGQAFTARGLKELHGLLRVSAMPTAWQGAKQLKDRVDFEAWLKDFLPPIQVEADLDLLTLFTEMLSEAKVAWPDLDAWVKAFDSRQGHPVEECLRITTIYRVKGLEWRFVIMPDVNEGYMPDLRGGTDLCLNTENADRSFEPTDILVSERRVFYVGITRAIDHLFLFTSTRRSSRFLKEALEDEV